MKGIFITFEGVEGSGKSTQTTLLSDYLTKKDFMTFVTREPGGPKISEKIRQILLDKDNSEMVAETELLLYLASRAQHVNEWIKPMLDDNFIVICDRFYDSTIAYQGAARNLDLEKILILNSFATGGLKPDITFLIDIDPETSFTRLIGSKADRLESESIEFHKKVRTGYLNVAKKESDRFIIIDGSKNIEQIHKKIIDEVEKYIKGR